MNSIQYLSRLAREGADHRHWYRDSLQDIMTVCYRKNWGLCRFIDVLALTSPRLSVRRNVRVTIHYMSTGELLDGIIRSTGAAVTHYEETGVIRGVKTKPFAEALKGDPDAVVLDTWMARALGVDQKRFEAKRVRHSAARRVRYVSHLMGWTPAETQAAVWAATVKRAGRNVVRVNPIEELEYKP